MPRVVFLSVIAACLLWGCGPKFTLYEHSTRKLSERATIAVSVWDSLPKSFWGSKTSAKAPPLTALEGYLSVALMARGFRVKPVKLELLLNQQLLQRLLPDCGCQCRRPERSLKILGKHIGSVKVDESDPATPEKAAGKPDPRPRMLTETQRAQHWLFGLVELTDALPKKLKTRYLLVVHRFSRFGFSVYLVDLLKRNLNYAMVVSGNAPGFELAVGDPKAGKRIGAVDGDDSRMELLRLAQYVANNL
ncbi:hypothetical protein ACFL51_00050 [Myxococcota bacterium]